MTTLIANSKTAITRRKLAVKGTQVWTIDSGWGLSVPLVKMSADYVLTCIGDGSGPYDLIIVTTGGVTQYALVLKADLIKLPSFPINQEYIPYANTLQPYGVQTTTYWKSVDGYAWPEFLLEPIGAPKPAAGYPVFVLVHGGPLALSHADNLLDFGNRVAGHGGIAFLIDYRSQPDQGAGFPTTMLDVAAAVVQARSMFKSTWRPGITLVAHSFGGYPSSVLSLGGTPNVPPGGLPDAYVGVAAISSTAGLIPGTLAGSPDPVVIAGTNRPGFPVTIVRGSNDMVALADNKDGFALALHNGQHPGRNVMVLGAGHESVLMADVTLDAVFGARS